MTDTLVHVLQDLEGKMEQIKDLFNMFQAACCSTSSMSKKQPEGMSAMPLAQGYHHDGSLPDVPGMHMESKSVVKSAKTMPHASQVGGTPSTGTTSTVVPEVETGEGYMEEQEDPSQVDFEEEEVEREERTEGEEEDATTLPEQQQKQAAKIVIQDFVKEMVRGRKISVLSNAGAVRECTTRLSRKLDIFKIQAGNSIKEIPLKEIANIHIGQDTEAANIDAPVDELCCTMALTSGDCVTFRFPDITARDTFAMCMLMFVNGAHGHGN